MTDAELVRRKLTQLMAHLERLRRRRSVDVSVYLSDVDRQDAVALSLLVVVQEAADIAFHIAADEHWGVPRTLREGFDRLAEGGVIGRDLSEKLAALSSLRNRLAHGYAGVDGSRLWNELPGGLATFDAFVTAIVAFLGAVNG